MSTPVVVDSSIDPAQRFYQNSETRDDHDSDFSKDAESFEEHQLCCFNTIYQPSLATDKSSFHLQVKLQQLQRAYLVAVIFSTASGPPHQPHRTRMLPRQAGVWSLSRLSSRAMEMAGSALAEMVELLLLACTCGTNAFVPCSILNVTLIMNYIYIYILWCTPCASTLLIISSKNDVIVHVHRDRCQQHFMHSCSDTSGPEHHKFYLALDTLRLIRRLIPR